MAGIGDAFLIASLEAEAKKLEEMSDRLQAIILQSPSMSEAIKSKITQMAAHRQNEASEIRMLISVHN